MTLTTQHVLLNLTFLTKTQYLYLYKMASVSIKRKRVSKKLKSAWRKHTKVADVEEFLEEKRLEERLGSLSTIPDESLFRVDYAPSTEIIPSKKQRKIAASRPLKCFSALQPYTKVPDPISKRNRVRSKDERASEFVKKKEPLKVAKKLVKAEKNRAKDKKVVKAKRGEFNENLWDIDDKVKSEDWVETDVKKHNLRGVGIPVKTPVKSSKTKLPAIEPPHPGMSYNPSYEAHQDLLRKVAEKEQKLIKEEAHLTRVTRGMFSKVTEQKRDQNWLVEMSQGLPSTNSDKNDDHDDTDDEYKAVNPPVKNAKKTLKQRRKKKEHLETEKAIKKVKLQKKKITDIHNLKKIVKSIDSVDVKQTKLREIRRKKNELKKDQTKVLSAVKYEEPDLEFNLGEEIAGNLKNLKTEGNLLADRFKSMQKRNILAPTKRVTIKKPKLKKYVKPGHREGDWKKTVARSYKVM